MQQLAIIGAGNIGSRHLQGLARLKFPATIWVVDHSAEALKLAEERFKEIESADKTTHFISSIQDIKETNIDLAIIATDSGHRLAALTELTGHCQVKYLILEKVLFPALEDYPLAEKIIREHNIKAWVNCPRRLNKYYQELKNKLGSHLKISVTGNDWGLGSNALHFIDLFAFLTDAKQINLSEAIFAAIPAKRAGYQEFFGTIRGEDEHHNLLDITCFEAQPLIVTVAVYSDTAYYIIDEGKPSSVRYKSADTNWQWQEESFNIDYQNVLTTVAVQEILETGQSVLPSFAQSAVLHVTYLNMMLAYLKKNSTDKNIKQCPIT